MEKRVWFPDDKEGWLLGVANRSEGKLLQVTAPSGGVCYLLASCLTYNQVVSCSLDNVIEAHEEPENVDDLIRLNDLNEGSLLWTLRERYSEDVPVIYVGC